jgi:hypothetical protein
VRAAWLLLLAGCDQIFKLTPPDEPEPTVPPRVVTVTYDRLVFDNSGPLPVVNVDPETFFVTRLDGSEIPSTRTGLGTYQFLTDAATYAVSAASPYGGMQFQFGGDTVHIRERVLGRIARTAPQPNTILQFDWLSVPNPTDKTAYSAFTTGTWAQASITRSNGELDYRQMTSLTGPLGIIDASKGDELFMLQYGNFVDTNQSTRFQLLGYVHSTPTIVQGGTTPIPGDIVPTGASQCMTLSAARADELARLQSVVPSSFQMPNADWSVSSVPHFESHVGGASLLAQSRGTARVAAYDAAFENPISDSTIASIGASLLRYYVVPGANTETQLTYEVRTYNEPVALVPGAACTPQDLPAGRIALVASISVDGRVLARDDLEIDADSDKPLDITWSPTEGDVDYYTTYLIEMVPIPAAASGDVNTIQVAKIGVTSTGTRAVVPRVYLERDHYYFIAVESNTGFPKAAAGDFSTIKYPRGITRAVSGVFKAD